MSSFLNPQGPIGQLIFAVVFGTAVWFGGAYWATNRHECPPTTSNSINFEKVKGGKSSTISVDAMLAPKSGCNHISWYNGLTKKEKRNL